MAKAIQAINSYHPYKMPFSRTQLLFSPFIFQAKTAHMALNNPVKTIKRGYKELNDKRILNLLGRKGKSDKLDWKLGAFVLLNDEPQAKSECKGKLNIPHQSRIYKIIDLHHDGFTCTLLDMIDGSKREVLHSRLMNLDLETLENYNFATPGLYRNLQKITDLQRNRYQAPTSKPKGLRLLSDLHPSFDKSDADYIPEPREEQGEETELVNIAQPEEQAHITELDEPAKRITRFKGEKHVPIYNTELVEQRSILKNSLYSMFNNFQVEKIRTIPEDQFMARLQALGIHSDICKINSCQICKIAKQVAGFKFNPGDYSRYVAKKELLHPVENLKHRKSIRRVIFNSKTLDNEMKPFQRIPMNLAMIDHACRFNVSFKELKGLNIIS